MDQNKTALERAFELARSGRFQTVTELKKVVSREGYQASQLEGSQLSRQLTALIRESNPAGPEQAASPAVPTEPAAPAAQQDADDTSN
jgi:hypothetical protein